MRAQSGTIVCDDITAAAIDLRLIRQLRRLTRPGPTNMRLGAAGTHPFSLFENQKITARDRYRAGPTLQYVARRELVFGLHGHVAVPTPEACLAVMEGVLIELPSCSRSRPTRRSGAVTTPGSHRAAP